MNPQVTQVNKIIYFKPCNIIYNESSHRFIRPGFGWERNKYEWEQHK